MICGTRLEGEFMFRCWRPAKHSGPHITLGEDDEQDMVALMVFDGRLTQPTQTDLPISEEAFSRFEDVANG